RRGAISKTAVMRRRPEKRCCGGQGVHRKVESEGHEEKYRAVSDGGYSLGYSPERFHFSGKNPHPSRAWVGHSGGEPSNFSANLTLVGSGGAVADGLGGESRLLADVVGDLGEITFVGLNSGKVVRLADEVEGAQGFPDLVGAGLESGDRGAGNNVLSDLDSEGGDVARHGRADVRGPAACVELGDQAALVHGRIYFVQVDNFSR